MEYFSNLTRKYPKFYRIWLGPFRAAISLNHPDTVRALLKTAGRSAGSYSVYLVFGSDCVCIVNNSCYNFPLGLS